MDSAPPSDRSVAAVSEILNKDPDESQTVTHPHIGSTHRHSTSPHPPALDNNGPLTPESPPLRMLRKRLGSLTSREEKESELGDKSPRNIDDSLADSAAHVCLCQPDPKIPRPRNGEHGSSFMLSSVP